MTKKTILSEIFKNTIKPSKSQNNKHKSFNTILNKKIKTLQASGNKNKPQLTLTINNDLQIQYIITVSFLRTNIFIHLSDSNHKTYVKLSTGHVEILGQRKRKNKKNILLKMLRDLSEEALFVKKSPVALHLLNVRTYKKLLLTQLKNVFYIKTVKAFNQTPHNGCRNKKIKRKKRSKQFK